MAGLVPAIHDLILLSIQDVDARDKRGHDDSEKHRRGIVGKLGVECDIKAGMRLCERSEAIQCRSALLRRSSQ
jgi:hypothetical protein